MSMQTIGRILGVRRRARITTECHGVERWGAGYAVIGLIRLRDGPSTKLMGVYPSEQQAEAVARHMNKELNDERDDDECDA